jgi:hypothetical protein
MAGADSTLQRTQDMFGNPMREEYRQAIRQYITQPTTDAWNEIFGIIVWPKPGMGRTIWQAVLEIDPTFPRRGRSETLSGEKVTDWERIPTPFQVLRAIDVATRERRANNGDHA